MRGTVSKRMITKDIIRIKAETVSPLLCKDDGMESNFPVGIKFHDKTKSGQILFDLVVLVGEVEDTGIKSYIANQELISTLFKISVLLFIASFLLNFFTGYFGYYLISSFLNPIVIICYLTFLFCIIDLLREELASTRHRFNIETRQELYQIYSYPSSKNELKRLSQVRNLYLEYLNRVPNDEIENITKESEKVSREIVEVNRTNTILSSILAGDDIINGSMKEDLKSALNKLNSNNRKQNIDVLKKLSSSVKGRIVEAIQEEDMNQKRKLLIDAVESLSAIKEVAYKLPVNQDIWDFRVNELIAVLNQAVQIRS